MLSHIRSKYDTRSCTSDNVLSQFNRL